MSNPKSKTCAEWSRSIENLKAQIAPLFHRRRRGRLVRHYFLISLLLIAGGLISSALVEIVIFAIARAKSRSRCSNARWPSVAALKIETLRPGHCVRQSKASPMIAA